VYLCYIDESGTPDLPGNTSHYVLAGISIPISHWKDCDTAINDIKAKYGIIDAEIHTAWALRRFQEQTVIQNFDQMNWNERRYEVERLRKEELLRLQKVNRSLYKQTKKNYKNTDSYKHLSYSERREMIIDVATCISKWGNARLFAECVDKIHFDPIRAQKTVDEQSFEQVVSRFEAYLQLISHSYEVPLYGLLIHDNNETVAKRHTELMKRFHERGTLWTEVNRIIETPLFVDSQLTGMIQIADLCAYALRRYLENQEDDLFDLVFARADRKGDTAVGVRHFTQPDCTCKICLSHRKQV